MNFYRMRRQFDVLMRTLGEDDFREFRDDWLNDGWFKISGLFRVPTLKHYRTWTATIDQQEYYFPYDYGGTEVYLIYEDRRLDPVPEHVLALHFEKRSGNLGAVEFYDLSGTAESPLASVTCSVSNGDTSVTCADAAAAHDDQFLRFDPSGTTDPGDYGYLIESVEAGVGYTLTTAYRGPDLTDHTAQVRPAETLTFKTYGIPTTAGTFKLEYFAKPRRLYNDTDVPEWPDMGMAIVYMAVSIGFEYHQNINLANQWFGRAMNRVVGLDRRTKSTNADLVHHITLGSVSGRHTGVRGVRTGLGSRWRR